jgi:hypothetical protein
MDNDQLEDYFLPLFGLAMVLIIVGIPLFFIEARVGIPLFLGGLLILAFLWYSANISAPRAERRWRRPFPRAEEISAARESHGLTEPRARKRYNDQTTRLADFAIARETTRGAWT